MSKQNRKEKPKTWSRKGKCPSCNVGTGCKHKATCTFSYHANITITMCPMCAMGELEYRHNNVHYWVCSDCPFVGFEYYNKEDTKNLSKALK